MGCFHKMLWCWMDMQGRGRDSPGLMGVQKEKGPGNLSGAPRSRSYDDIALHLLSSRLACLRCGSSNPYIGLHLLSDDPLAYSARSVPGKREGKTTR